MRATKLFSSSSAFFVALVLATSPAPKIRADDSFLPNDSLSPAPASLPEMIASQITNGNLSCPTYESLTQEACLIYQGALGVWQMIGKPDRCPAVVDNPAPLPSPAELTTDDVLRAPTVPCFSYIYSAQVANTVPILISTANRAFRIMNGTFAEPGSNPKLSIEARHGLCGSQAAVAIALFEKAGFRARPVEFYYKNKLKQRFSHVIVEVLIDRDWRLIDTTYGAYWIDGTPGSSFALRTLEQILQPDPQTRVVRNNALTPYGLYEQISHADFFAYLTHDADVLRGGEGEIKLSLHGGTGIENFDSIPNFIGDNVADGNQKGVSYRLIEDPGTYHVTVNVAGSAEIGDRPIHICLDESCEKFSDSQREYYFKANNAKVLHLKSDADVAYIVLKSIEWKLEN